MAQVHNIETISNMLSLNRDNYECQLSKNISNKEHHLQKQHLKLNIECQCNNQ